MFDKIEDEEDAKHRVSVSSMRIADGEVLGQGAHGKE